jgi:hypothetical protein
MVCMPPSDMPLAWDTGTIDAACSFYPSHTQTHPSSYHTYNSLPLPPLYRSRCVWSSCPPATCPSHGVPALSTPHALSTHPTLRHTLLPITPLTPSPPPPVQIEVRMVFMPPSDMPLAWDTGTIDAAWAWNPARTELIQRGGVLLVPSGLLGEWGRPTLNLIVARTAFLRSHPLAVEHLVRLMAMLDGAWVREASLAAAADGLERAEDGWADERPVMEREGPILKWERPIVEPEAGTGTIIEWGAETRPNVEQGAGRIGQPEAGLSIDPGASGGGGPWARAGPAAVEAAGGAVQAGATQATAGRDSEGMAGVANRGVQAARAGSGVMQGAASAPGGELGARAGAAAGGRAADAEATEVEGAVQACVDAAQDGLAQVRMGGVAVQKGSGKSSRRAR